MPKVSLRNPFISQRRWSHKVSISPSFLLRHLTSSGVSEIYKCIFSPFLCKAGIIVPESDLEGSWHLHWQIKRDSDLSKRFPRLRSSMVAKNGCIGRHQFLESFNQGHKSGQRSLAGKLTKLHRCIAFFLITYILYIWNFFFWSHFSCNLHYNFNIFNSSIRYWFRSQLICSIYK